MHNLDNLVVPGTVAPVVEPCTTVAPLWQDRNLQTTNNWVTDNGQHNQSELCYCNLLFNLYGSVLLHDGTVVQCTLLFIVYYWAAHYHALWYCSKPNPVEVHLTMQFTIVQCMVHGAVHQGMALQCTMPCPAVHYSMALQCTMPCSAPSVPHCTPGNWRVHRNHWTLSTTCFHYKTLSESSSSSFCCHIA